MLGITERSTDVENFRPPIGFQIDYLIGTTFSLDLHSLMTLSLSLCLFDHESKGEERVFDPLALLEASRRMSSRMLIFYEPGEIKNQKKYNKLYYLLEEAVFQGHSPFDGAFHPKVYFMKFSNDEESIARLIVSSRNLTFDQSWDVSCKIDGDVSGPKNSNSKSISDFFRLVANDSLPEAKMDLLDEICEDLDRFDFEPPKGIRETSFRPMGVKARDSAFLKDYTQEGGRVLVASPFLNPKFLSELDPQKGSVLISRQDSLDEIHSMAPDCLEPFGDEVYILHDDAIIPNEETDDDDEKSSASSISGDLHAKLLFFESGKNTTLLLGSGNATEAAFGLSRGDKSRNVEFMLELNSRTDRYGIDAFLGNDERNGISKILTQYIPSEWSEAEKKKKLWERQLLSVKRSLFKAKMSVTYLAEADKISLNLQVKGISLPQDAAIRIWPVTRPSHKQELDTGGMKFDLDSLDDVTSLFCFGISIKGYKEFGESVFTQKLDAIDFPKERSDMVIQSLVDSEEKFRKFLFYLMNLGNLDDLTNGVGSKRSKGGGGSASGGGGTLNIPLFEELLRSLSSGSKKFEEINDTLQILAKSSDVMPKQFLEMWEQFRKAAEGLKNENI